MYYTVLWIFRMYGNQRFCTMGEGHHWSSIIWKSLINNQWIKNSRKYISYTWRERGDSPNLFFLFKWTCIYKRMYNTMGSDGINLIRYFCMSKDRKKVWVVVRSVWENTCVHTYSQNNGFDCSYLTWDEVFIKIEYEETGRSGNTFCMNSLYLRL